MADCIDESLLPLLPWLASRFNMADGSFRGEGVERDAPPAFLSAQGRASLQALGIYARLPHIVRAKLDQWPPVESARLAGPAENSPLARALRLAPAGRSEALAFRLALRPYLSSDFGYTLRPEAGAPGLLAAAYHLLVVVRPAWFESRARPLPSVSDQTTLSLMERLLATHAP